MGGSAPHFFGTNIANVRDPTNLFGEHDEKTKFITKQIIQRDYINCR